ncbi:lipid A deacylase LpxR family protein [Microbulbifer bruguierae]|uniref:Lipid A deacylase LpxR family protein n=1 Tax=Microbulbifer bruguierae TaxID=3029061 RepID=A0ABY8NBI4_9GAMM|nr:lipid A deacylase LpxR family protein [Microbulbifer bruguierae]WGL15800.1 lipid A deacylase LpxR family protein [Microbulbifer bruguierae]
MPVAAGTLSIQAENDSINSSSDEDYTNGVRFSYSPDEPASWLSSWLPDAYDNREINAQFFLGHAIFTPTETFAYALQEDDRPYAGWVYVGAGLHSVVLNPESRLGVAERLELNLGVVGPSSHAAEFQRSWHRLIHGPIVNGWENQLADEPALMFSYARKWAYFQPLGETGLEFEWSGTLGGNLGNVSTQWVSAAGLRFGHNLLSSMGVSAIAPTTVAPESGAGAGNSWYLFAEFQWRFVGRDIFLDGNTFKESHSVEKESQVGDWRVGLVIPTGRLSWSLYSSRRTREFVGQTSDVHFSGLGISASF